MSFIRCRFARSFTVHFKGCKKKQEGWACYYNNDRAQQGWMCCGRTPMETLRDSKSIWAEKNLAQIQTDRHLIKIGSCQLSQGLLKFIGNYKY